MPACAEASAGRQGKKSFKPKMFFNFFLPDQIPDDNFYKVLKKHLDLRFIYSGTKHIYSHTCLIVRQAGRPTLDPVVFFKCLLIGYLENQPEWPRSGGHLFR
jgi:hypothetical protein